jgi:hypothetical protein
MKFTRHLLASGQRRRNTGFGAMAAQYARPPRQPDPAGLDEDPR